MLILTRKVGESVVITTGGLGLIRISVEKTGATCVRLGIESPAGCLVLRGELADSHDVSEGGPHDAALPTEGHSFN